MSRRKATLAVAAVALAALACPPTGQEASSGALSDADSAAIEGVIQGLVDALVAEDYASAAAMYTEDGTRMPPNAPPQVGRPMIEAAYEALPGRYAVIKAPVVEMSGRGDLAFARGTYSIEMQISGREESMLDDGKYLLILWKQLDGRWLISSLIFNSNLELPEQEL